MNEPSYSSICNEKERIEDEGITRRVTINFFHLRKSQDRFKVTISDDLVTKFVSVADKLNRSASTRTVLRNLLPLFLSRDRIIRE